MCGERLLIFVMCLLIKRSPRIDGTYTESKHLTGQQTTNHFRSNYFDFNQHKIQMFNVFIYVWLLQVIQKFDKIRFVETIRLNEWRMTRENFPFWLWFRGHFQFQLYWLMHALNLYWFSHWIDLATKINEQCFKQNWGPFKHIYSSYVINDCTVHIESNKIKFERIVMQFSAY